MAKTKKTSPKKAGDTVKITGVRLNSSSEALVLAKIFKRVEEKSKTFIVTPNPEFLVLAQENPWFEKILNKADIAVPDGMGLVWASRFLAFRPLATLFSLMENLPPHFARSCPLDLLKKVASRPVLKERISGTDLVGKLCQEAAKRGWSVYLLGGKSGVAKKTLEVLQGRYPGLKGWAESGPELKLEVGSGKWEVDWEARSKGWAKKISQGKPDLLFVAFGMGKQEKFIWDNWNQLNVKLAMGVGGAFDYLSGRVPRAPRWVQKAGFEWLYRLIREPWRWRRQLALAKFVWLVFKQKMVGAKH